MLDTLAFARARTPALEILPHESDFNRVSQAVVGETCQSIGGSGNDSRWGGSGRLLLNVLALARTPALDMLPHQSEFNRSQRHKPRSVNYL